MPTVEETKAKVQRLLTSEFGSIRVDKDGDFVLTHNSATVFVEVQNGMGKADTVIQFTCPLVVNLPLSGDLYKWIATEGQEFRLGSVKLWEGERPMVVFQYSIIGDDVDPSELFNAVAAVAITGDQLDNQIRDKFGGELFGDE